VSSVRPVAIGKRRTMGGTPKRTARRLDRCWRLGGYLLPGDSLDAVAGKLNFKALLRQRVRCVALPLPVVKRPILPWALFPFKVPRLSLPFRWEIAFLMESDGPMMSAASGVRQGSR
jgi:hypothetical protein